MVWQRPGGGWPEGRDRVGALPAPSRSTYVALKGPHPGYPPPPATPPACPPTHPSAHPPAHPPLTPHQRTAVHARRLGAAPPRHMAAPLRAGRLVSVRGHGRGLCLGGGGGPVSGTVPCSMAQAQRPSAPEPGEPTWVWLGLGARGAARALSRRCNRQGLRCSPCTRAGGTRSSSTGARNVLFVADWLLAGSRHACLRVAPPARVRLGIVIFGPLSGHKARTHQPLTTNAHA